MFLFVAITLFCILVVMHANYVQQITSAGLWSHSDESTAAYVPQVKAAADNLQVSKTDQGDSLSSGVGCGFKLVWIEACRS
ncbi:hypothetical protein YC2023_033362 [Brassica napus]